MPPRPWTVVSKAPLAETRVFDLMELRSRRGEDEGRFVTLDCPDWVNVIALTQDGRVVLVEQWRHGAGALTLEIPGGMVDPGEDMLTAGVRELAEETGFVGGQARLIGVVQPNPALQGNLCGTLLIEGVRLREEGAAPEGFEELDVHLLPLERVHAAIREGRIQHALVVAAFMHLQLEAHSRGE